MTDLPSNRAYIQVEETDSESPVSEQTLQKIGSAINFLNDLFQQAEIFTSNGTFTVPEGVTRLYIYGAGGGGGGGGGGQGLQGGGGYGAIPSFHLIPVTPLDVFSVTIGAGGNGGYFGSSFSPGEHGKQGGTTSLGSLINFYGAPGGQGRLGNSSDPNPGNFNIINAAGILYSAGGQLGSNGQTSIFASGGAGAALGTGGGGAGLLAGANGTTSAGSPNSASANSSAGGGGGAATGANSPFPGGNGGSGFLYIGY